MMTKRYEKYAYSMVLPVMVLIVLFKIYPVLYSIIGSFFTVSAGQSQRFVGITNFISVFKETVFQNSFFVTIKFNILLTPIQIILAILLAMMVNTKIKGIHVFRTIFYMPVGVPISIAAIIWGMMLMANGGLINGLLSLIRIPPQPFLTSKDQALYAIIIMATWQGVGYWMVFILAGLQGIPDEIYEAARIDGSGATQTFFAVTLPSLRNVIIFVLVSDSVVNILLFAPMYLLTDGGPQRSTNLLMLEAYKTLYRSTDPSRAYVIITSLIALGSLVVLLQMFLLREKD